jgi:hypothetical protein
MSTLLVVTSVCALLVAARTVQATTAALLGLVRELTRAIFVNVGRLLVIGACLICLLVVLAHSLVPAGPVGLH